MSIDIQLRKVVGGEGGEGGVNQQSTQEGCRWGGRGGVNRVNLERIHKDLARITSDNVDPVILGGSIDSQLGKGLQTHCKDYLTMLIL